MFGIWLNKIDSFYIQTVSPNNQFEMSSSSSSNISLISNPKTRKDWENNKLYYQQKFFSKSQKNILREMERKTEIALKHISTRQPHVSGVNGGKEPEFKKKNAAWKYHAESMNLYQKGMIVESPQSPPPTPLSSPKIQEEFAPRISQIEVEDWEELC